MCTAIIENPADFIALRDDTLKTTSLKVAQAFGKRHDNVVRSMNSLDCSDEFRVLNFEETPYTNEQNGETYTLWEMTKDGFMFLVMGFTGKKAAQIKEAYITAFNQMAEQLSGKSGELPQQESLTASECQAIRELVKAKVEETGQAYPAIYARLQNKFRVNSYKALPREKLADAIVYITGIQTVALPATVHPFDKTATVNQHNIEALISHCEQAYQISSPMLRELDALMSQLHDWRTRYMQHWSHVNEMPLFYGSLKRELH